MEAESSPRPPRGARKKKRGHSENLVQVPNMVDSGLSDSSEKSKKGCNKKRTREASDVPAITQNKKRDKKSKKNNSRATIMAATERKDVEKGDRAESFASNAAVGMTVTNKREEPLLVVPWMREPVRLDDFGEQQLTDVPCLHPKLRAALQEMRIKSLFPVQVAVWLESIGPGAFERDICVNSPTGSGKTLSYALPIVQMLSTCKLRCLRALVVVPTRLLALQVKKVFDAIAPAVGLSVGSAIGQSSIIDETEEIIKKPKFEQYSTLDPEYCPIQSHTSVDILVATPGRLMDHINMTQGFTLEHLQYLVIDETDRLLRVAYQSWLPTVIQLTRPTDQESNRRVCSRISDLTSLMTFRRCGVQRDFKGKCYPRLAKIILSATLTQDPSKLCLLDLHHPLLLTSGRYKMPEGLKFYKMICKLKYKPLYLFVLLQKLKGEKCLVFTKSVQSTHRLTTLLGFFEDKSFQFSAISSLQHGSISIETLESYKEGKIQVLIATDFLARGVDDEMIKNVINYDMPQHSNTYIHRAGRTARAGQEGRCFTFMGKHEVKRFDEMLKKVHDVQCHDYSLPQESIDSLLLMYSSALEKAKDYFNTSRASSLKFRRRPSKHNNMT